ncbi:hypothetical protein [Cupriavidus pinatubonensis]|uniref:Uncharacterized protein n=1 Tax=Cupriavidus pinatubonensis TaxID=248026 RepID=A0ABM8Y462_9BURK|nr:hypothetical protein [Cupriavidus pinatubonensis]CAG9187572.1 hypothetical protein LMG23994_07017 [Cupriavidus pinatubonensis]
MEEKVIDIASLTASKRPVFPENFQHLNAIAQWSLPTETARNVQRHRVTIEEIRSFVDIMLKELDGVLAYLNMFEVDSLPPEAQALMNLVLSLAEVSPAVEFYNQPAVIDGYDPRRLVADSSFKLSPVF